MGLNHTYSNVSLHVRGINGDLLALNVEDDAGTERFRVFNDGHAGVNQTYPDVGFNVRGINGDPVAFNVEDDASNKRFTVQNDGDIGIGTVSPLYKLHLSNGTSGLAINSGFGTGMLITGDSPQPRVYFEHPSATSGQRVMLMNFQDGKFSWKSTNDDGTAFVQEDILVLETDGNVGIGTPTPTEKLDVAGTVRATGLQLPTGAAADYVLTSDATGTASWQPLIDPALLPSPATLSGSLAIGNDPNSVAVQGSFAYVTDSSSDDLKVIDVSDPANPVLSGSLAIGGFPNSVAVQGSFAYVVDQGSYDLKVIDVSDPVSPTLSGSLAIGNFPVSVAVQGSFAYVVDLDSEDLKVIDVSDPASPSLSGSLAIGSSPQSVAVQGSFAYVVDFGSDDLKVIDVSDPASPALSGSLAIGDLPWSVAVQGGFAYVVDRGSDDLKVIDVSDPASPSLSGSLAIGNFPVSVAVQGSFAYVVDFDSKDLKVIDVSDPASPTLSGSLAIGDLPISVAVQGSFAYVVDLVSADLKVIQLGGTAVLGIDLNGEVVSSPLQSSSSGNVGIGRTPVTNLLEVEGEASKSSAGDWLANSDARLKKNIRPLDSEVILQKMLSLQGVTYEWDDDQTGSERPEGTMYGFTAQNIQSVFPELVEEDNLGFLQTAYGTYDAMTVEALRALNDKVEKLEDENDGLRAEVETMLSQLAEMDELKQRMARLEATLLGSAGQSDGED